MEKGPSENPDAVPDEPENRAVEAHDQLSMNEVIQDIKVLLEKHKDPSELLQEYLNKVEEHIEIVNKNELNNVDRGEIKDLILRHPFFKNPNDFSIRLITIMKYLKKKGINIAINDMDLLVEEIILTIDGVSKVGYGKYARKKH